VLTNISDPRRKGASELENTVNLDDREKDTKWDIDRYITTRIKEAEYRNLGTNLLGGGHHELEDQVIQVMQEHANGMYGPSMMEHRPCLRLTLWL
jgi:hypothetical protein